MEKGKIRVLVTDDSMVFRESVARGLMTDPDIEVIGKAENPLEAMRIIKEKNPSVMTLDVHMPEMNGIDFLKKIMAESPMPVVVVSSVSENVFDALNAGAVDFVTKPTEGKKVPSFTKELIAKVKIASVAKLKINSSRTAQPASGVKSGFGAERRIPVTKTTADTRITADTKTTEANRVKRMYASQGASALSKLSLPSSKKDTIIAIGASTGGTEAILAVIKDLPADTPGIVIVQHMPPGFTAMYARRADNICNMSVKEAADGDCVERGRILIAPGALQMQVKKDMKGYYVSCKPGEKVSGHAPSVDVMFRSVAEVAGANSVGIILTGMGSDGAKGLLEMRKKGAFTIGQDERTCVVYGMPKVSYNIGAVARQAGLDNIAGILINYLNKP